MVESEAKVSEYIIYINVDYALLLMLITRD